MLGVMLGVGVLVFVNVPLVFVVDLVFSMLPEALSEKGNSVSSICGF